MLVMLIQWYSNHDDYYSLCSGSVDCAGESLPVSSLDNSLSLHGFTDSSSSEIVAPAPHSSASCTLGETASKCAYLYRR